MAQLDVEKIKQIVKTKTIGKNIIYFPITSSTMDEARKLVTSYPNEGVVIVADKQTTGRGRFKREWISPNGGLYYSVILYPSKQLLPFLVMITSLAVSSAVEKQTGVKTNLKWPNDVMVGEKKIAGILIESHFTGRKVDYSIVGVGINVNVDIRLMQHIIPNPTSLLHELGYEISREELISKFIVGFDTKYNSLPQNIEKVFTEWQHKLTMLGKPIVVSYYGETIEGFAESVDKDGSLIIKTTSGKRRQILAGDVYLH
jgi:BirA family biotin operon repressor/biotin-[acetyl-CoA-carboxylase] ligase